MSQIVISPSISNDFPFCVPWRWLCLPQLIPSHSHFHPHTRFRNSVMSVGCAVMGRELRKRISKSHLPTRIRMQMHTSMNSYLVQTKAARKGKLESSSDTKISHCVGLPVVFHCEKVVGGREMPGNCTWILIDYETEVYNFTELLTAMGRSCVNR